MRMLRKASLQGLLGILTVTGLIGLVLLLVDVRTFQRNSSHVYPSSLTLPEASDPTEQALLSSSSVCPIAPNTFRPLTTFQFWGRTMNVSSPCPTAGMSNQLVMVMGLLHCAQSQRLGGTPFRFKDITCSPTGGKDGRRGYRVGSDDYEYAWFRWSEIYDIQSPKEKGGAALCLADEHSWSEHPWMKSCPTTVDGIYGSPAYWKVRSYLMLHNWYDKVALDFLASHNLKPFSPPLALAGSGGNAEEEARGSFIALHVRRGDYENFCRQTSKSSGVKKFLTAPFRWLRHNSTTLGSKFMQSCFPSTSLIAQHLRTVVRAAENSKKKTTTPTKITHVYVATNSPAFVADLRQAVAGSNLTIITLSEYFSDAKEEATVRRAYWPSQSKSTKSDGTFSTTELAMLDINIMSMAHVMVLNKYSTFSQSAIDVRVLRFMHKHQGKKEVVHFDPVDSPSLFWW